MTPQKANELWSRDEEYLLQDYDALLVVLVSSDVKRGPPISRDDGIVHLRVLPDVEVVCLDPAHSGPHRGGLRDP